MKRFFLSLILALLLSPVAYSQIQKIPRSFQMMDRDAAYGESSKEFQRGAIITTAIQVLTSCFIQEDKNKYKAEDLEKAFAIMTHYGEQGHPVACYISGFYLTAKGEFGKAIYWYKKGVEHGCEVCADMLADAFTHGKGVNIDFVEAGKWIIISGALGYYENAEKTREYNNKFNHDPDWQKAKKVAFEWQNQHEELFVH